MASRTKQKEEARARRLAEEQARAERARRQQRIRMIGGVVVVVAVVVSSGGSKTGGSAEGEAVGASQTKQLLTGVPQKGNTLGNPKAKVTMTYYGDLKCPVCQAFTVEGGFPQLVSNEVRSGKVKVVYDAFCTATCNGPAPQEFPVQQAAALAAGKQARFWQFTELFYRQQGSEEDAYVTEAFLDGLARQAGVNVAQWKTARNDPNLTAEVTSQQNGGKKIGVSGTPTLVFQGPKGQAVPNSAVPTYAQLQQAIKQVS